MAYGKLKADTLVYDNSGSDAEIAISTIGAKANVDGQTFTGNVVLPSATTATTQSDGDNSTKLATTAYADRKAPKASPTFTGTVTIPAGASISGFAPLAAPAFTGTATGVNLTLSGDLTVNGTTTTIDTTNLTVEDPLISLAKNNNSANTVDIGFYGLYDATGSQDVYAGLFRDASDSGKWKLFELNQAAPTTTVDTSGTGYAAATLVVGTVEDSKGNVRNIPASTNTTLVAADAGKHISITAGITINASTDFAVGDAVTIFNNQAAGNDETITATGIDLYLATDASVSGATNRTLAPRGVATILCVAADKYVITGAGLS
jgi:hypothetical protein